MNCKPGDLAIVVQSRIGNLGKVVRCIRLATDADLKAQKVMSLNEPYWVIEGTLTAMCIVTSEVGEVSVCPDAILRPLRGNEPETDVVTDKELEAA